MALNSCLKYAMTFLLGATVLSLLFFYEIKRDVIRVEINWGTRPRYASFSSASHAYRPMVMVARNTEELTSAINTSANVAHSRSKPVLTKSHISFDPADSEVRLQKANRHVRQLSKSKDHLSSVQQARGVTRPPPKARITNANNKSDIPVKNGRLIKDVLSKTAPDWVGETIPPVDLTENKCKDKICSEYLSGVELAQYETCINLTVIKEEKVGQIQPNVNCRFLNGTKRHPVALASFPGSGNTWMRGLLQKITGICTGSMYCDNVLRARGFTGEFIKGPSVIAIKTHSKKALLTHSKLPRRVFNHVPVYGAAILLVRDPMSALVSEWHRERTKRQTNATSSNHYLTVGEDYFQTNPKWGEYLEEESKRWSDEVSGWIIAAKDNPFLVVRYEDLKKDTIKEMKRVVDFLGFSHISEADITNKLGEGYNNFYRNHTDNFGHFTEEQKAVVQHQVEETIKKLRENGRDNVFPIHKYLQ